MRIGATRKAIYRGLSQNQLITTNVCLMTLTGYDLEDLFKKMIDSDFRDDVDKMFIFCSWIAAVTSRVSSGNMVPQSSQELNDAALKIGQNWWRSRVR